MKYKPLHRPTKDQTVEMWRALICAKGQELDQDHDKGGHDWFSLWCGFVIGFDRPDFATYEKYMSLGFPCEAEFALK